MPDYLIGKMVTAGQKVYWLSPEDVWALGGTVWDGNKEITNPHHQI
ncbi:MAG TPA: hypothetical protein VGJ20_24905 [Xanthobacteraceae bacterium]